MPVANPSVPRIGGPFLSATVGSIPFAATGPVFAQDNGNLFWDAPNARLGVGIPTPSYLAHFQRTETGIAGTVASVQIATVLNPPSASNAASAGFNVSVESGSGTSQNYTNLITGSFYQAFHRSSGTCTALRAMTANVQQTSTAGVVTTMEAIRLNMQVDATISSSVEGTRFSLGISAAGSVANMYAFRVVPATITAGGVLTNSYGHLVQNLGLTGVTNACGMLIYAQSGASTANVGLCIGQTSIPAGTHAIYVAANPITLVNSVDIVLGTGTGTKIGTATTQKLGFYNATPVVQQTDGAALTNSVTSGGTTDTIANYTDLVIYANDSAAIRNDLYQLARKVKIIGDSLRTYGFLS